MKSIYIIGSLRNPRIPEVANKLRGIGFEVFDDWYSPGPKTDDYWKEYEQGRKRSFKEALSGYHATEVFNFDKRHLDRCDIVILVLPAGKSGHLELGYTIGRGKPGYILLDPEGLDRFDLMYKFATEIFEAEDELFAELKRVSPE